MTGEEAAAAFQKTVDSTGDPYEDFPEDQINGKQSKASDVIKIANELKSFGNTAFKSGDVELGLDKYQKGLRYLNKYPAAEESDPPETAQQLSSIRFTLHSNSALLQNKLQQYNGAKDSANRALEIAKISDAEKAKAYYRKGLAEIGLKDDDEAIKDLAEALKLVPGDPAITKELITVKTRSAEKAKKEKEAFKKFFQ